MGKTNGLQRSRKALARTKAIIIVAIVIAAGVSAYLFNAIVAGGGYPPFCSGYPPGGNCHANYNYDFTITVNYSSSWQVSYRGFHNTEVATLTSAANYTGGTFAGKGFDTRRVELSGDNFHFLSLCATAYKLDGSSSNLTLMITGSNTTSVPDGSASICGSVAP